jgi:ELWxxDGT repeat protein
MGTTIYMAANDGSGGGIELHGYEVTNNSTWLAADIRPGVATSMLSDLVVLGTRVYMKATLGTHFEMLVYESGNNSFWEVSNIQSTSSTGGPTGLTVHEYTVYFSADDGTNGKELWAHNSINETTWLVIDLHPSGGSVLDIHEINGDVYFSADDGSTGIELWKLIFSKNVTYV